MEIQLTRTTPHRTKESEGAIRGKIVSAQRELYHVRIDANTQVLCKGRGVFREKGLTPIVGDEVSIDWEGGDEFGTITKILPRKNMLDRPPVANVDQVLLVQSVSEPALNPLVLDRYLAILEYKEIDAVLCFNKEDLIEESLMQEWIDRYQAAGYLAIRTSQLDDTNLPVLKEILHQKVTAISGPSGVGKSTLINRIVGESIAVAGEISQKRKRGKQTTRHIELYPIDWESWIYDTPGFTSVDLITLDETERLSDYFREMKPLSKDCRFRDCTHVNEPGCAVKAALQAGHVDRSRYDSYLKIYEEWKAQRRY